LVKTALPEELSLRPIEPGDVTTRFSLGSEEANPLKIFLKKEAKSYHQQSVGYTYVLVENKNRPVVWAYVTLNCSQIELAGADRPEDCEGNYCYSDFPAVKIARLAVHKDIRNFGYGSTLIDIAVATAKDSIQPHVGCRFVVVDAKQSAINFYQNNGFKLLDTETNKKSKSPVLFMDLLKI